jgi:F-type H+-transporting ATPase subunit epsilon
METLIQLTIKTPTKIFFKGQVQKVSLPTSKGYLTILPNHVNLVTMLEVGLIEIQAEKAEKFICFKGIVKVSKNTVSILTEEAANPADEVLAEISAAIESAKAGKPTSVILPADLIRAEKELKYYLLKNN